MASYKINGVDVSVLEVDDTIECDYSGQAKELELPPGQYQLECWGAQGGTQSNTYPGGNGGYSIGTLTLEGNTTLYIYSGGQSTTTDGGFNGGGTGATQDYGTTYGGGGASDIRIGTDSLYARVIVAGGGGSGYADSDGASYSGAGGVGGGTGGDGSYSGNNTPGTAGGGVFGIGADSNLNTSNYGLTTPGGGGWYGGGAGNFAGGGGGSGYVYTGSTASDYPSDCLLDSTYYLADATTINGDQTIPSTSGSTETGHEGNGYVRITVISFTLSHTYNIDDIDSSTIFEAGDKINCAYSGEIKNIILPKGIYRLECWGGAGGDGRSGSTNKGGTGGYSVGTYTIDKETTLFLISGGKGNSGATSLSIKTGGYNGGGNSGYNYGGSGGGATHIALVTGLLSTLSSQTDQILMVAGGGGGGAYYSKYYGGNGGGESGGNSSGYNTTNVAKGATQSVGGAAGGSSYIAGTAGSFGQGGAANTTQSSYNRSGGGGGGYYGGGGGGYRSSSSYYYYGCSGGGGGSGYVSSVLTDASTTQQSTSSNPDTTYNGYIRITVLEISNSFNIKIKVGGAWKEVSTILTKIGGTWKEIDSLLVKNGGAWKESG